MTPPDPLVLDLPTGPDAIWLAKVMMLTGVLGMVVGLLIRLNRPK